MHKFPFYFPKALFEGIKNYELVSARYTIQWMHQILFLSPSRAVSLFRPHFIRFQCRRDNCFHTFQCEQFWVIREPGACSRQSGIYSLASPRRHRAMNNRDVNNIEEYENEAARLSSGQDFERAESGTFSVPWPRERGRRVKRSGKKFEAHSDTFDSAHTLAHFFPDLFSESSHVFRRCYRRECWLSPLPMFLLPAPTIVIVAISSFISFYLRSDSRNVSNVPISHKFPQSYKRFRERVAGVAQSIHSMAFIAIHHQLLLFYSISLSFACIWLSSPSRHSLRFASNHFILLMLRGVDGDTLSRDSSATDTVQRVLVLGRVRSMNRNSIFICHMEVPSWRLADAALNTHARFLARRNACGKEKNTVRYWRNGRAIFFILFSAFKNAFHNHFSGRIFVSRSLASSFFPIRFSIVLTLQALSLSFALLFAALVLALPIAYSAQYEQVHVEFMRLLIECETKTIRATRAGK